MKHIFTLLFTLLFVASFGQTTLQLNLEEGKTYNQITLANSKVSQTVGGQSVDVEIVIAGNMSYKVISAGSDSYEMDVQYTELSMNMKTMQGEASFSSESPSEGDIMSMLLSNMKKNPFSVTLMKNGKIDKITNMDAMFNAMFEGMGPLTDEQKSQMTDQMRQSFGESALKGNLELATAVFPDKPVNKGDTWEIQTAISSTITADVTNTFTYEGKDGDYDVITGSGNFKTDPSKTSSANGMAMTYDLSGTMDSKLKLDPTTGWIVEAQITQNMEGNASVQGMNIPMILKSSTTITDQ